MAHSHIVGGILDAYHPNIRRNCHGQTKTHFEENLAMDKIAYCLSYSELVLILAIAAINMLTLLAVCIMTRRQCIKDGCMS